MTRTNRVIGMHQSIVVGAIARKTQHHPGALTRSMSIDFKTLKTSFKLKEKRLLVLVTYLDERRTGVEVMVATAVETNGML